jgi:hypothetical protein
MESRWIVVRFGAFVALGALLVAALALVAAAGPASPITLVWEAENYTQIQGLMTASDQPPREGRPAPSGGAIFVPADNKEDNHRAGLALYKIDVPADGKYVLWGRKYWLHGCGNSMLVSVDTQKNVLGEDGNYERWQWWQLQTGDPESANRQPAVFDLKKGVHIIIVANREDGARLDQLCLTTNQRVVPGGGYNALKPTPGVVTDGAVDKKASAPK